MNKPLNPSAGMTGIKTIRDIGGVLNWVSYTRAVVVAHAIPSCAQVRFLPALPGYVSQCALFPPLFGALGFLLVN